MIITITPADPAITDIIEIHWPNGEMQDEMCWEKIFDGPVTTSVKNQ